MPELIDTCTEIEGNYNSIVGTTEGYVMYKLLSTAYEEKIDDSIDEYINDLYDYDDYLDLVEFLKATGRFDQFKSSLTALESKLSQKKQSVNVTYTRTVGVNGTITYRCTKTCNESCVHCRKCKLALNGSHKCTFEYSFHGKDGGWIGCPECQDIPGWQDWYKEKLKGN